MWFLEGTFGGTNEINGKQYLRLGAESIQTMLSYALSGGPVVIAEQFAGIMALGNPSERVLYAIPIFVMLESKVGDAVRGLVRDVPRWVKAEDIARFSEDVRGVLARAQQISGSYKRRHVHAEHLLLALAERTGTQFAALIAEGKINLPQILEPGLGPSQTPQTAEEENPEFTGFPAVSGNVRRAIVTAMDKATADGRTTIELAHLLFGVLSATRNARVKELNRLGITPSRVTLPPPLPEDRRSFLAGYNSDEACGTDLLNITEEVNTFASVLAAKGVEPPLSLGLFGEWGSGKSFFMNLLEARIKKLAVDAKEAETQQAESAYCSNILQITFNAWNYIDSDLWASLTSEIFENLAAEIVRLRDPDPKADSANSRALVMAAASSSQAVLDEAERKKEQAEMELKQTEANLAALQQSEATIEAQLTSGEILKQAFSFAMQNEKMKEYVGKVSETLNIPEAKAAASEVQSEILELKGTWRTILFTLRQEKRLWMWFAALGAALGAGWLAERILDGRVHEFTARVVAALAAVGGLLLPFVQTSWKVAGLVSEAQKSKQELIKKKKEEQIEELTKRRDLVRQNVETEQKNVTAAHEKVKELNNQLETMRADRSMADFIRKRNQSTDYTQHLGVISRVRNDLKHLSTLLREVKEEAQEEFEEGIKQRQKSAGKGTKGTE